MMKSKKQKQPINARVVWREDFTDDLFCLWLDLGEHRQELTFKPGQYCTIRLADCKDPKNLWRAYSIASAPHERFIELFIELVPPPYGNLTPLLHRMKIGDAISVRPRAKGMFTLDSACKNQVMVATVTGIVPYISMLRDYIHRGESGHKFFVLHGASYYDELVYGDELGDIMLTTPNRIHFLYTPTVSRPDEERNKDWNGQAGRVNTIVEKSLSLWGLGKEDTLVYVCGQPGMIEDVKNRLLPKGWNVKEERFWKQ